MAKRTKKSSKNDASKVETTEANAVEVLEKVAEEQRNEAPTKLGEMTPEQREKDVQKLLHNLYNDESLTSRDKKVIRRTLRDKYNYYISRERKNAGNAVVNRILETSSRTGAA